MYSGKHSFGMVLFKFLTIKLSPEIYYSHKMSLITVFLEIYVSLWLIENTTTTSTDGEIYKLYSADRPVFIYR